VKEGMVGIYGEFQMGMVDWLWILRQAPLEMKGVDLRIPFHSQEELEWEGGEKRVGREILTSELSNPHGICIAEEFLA
jgi:hypothetical protein